MKQKFRSKVFTDQKAFRVFTEAKAFSGLLQEKNSLSSKLSTCSAKFSGQKEYHGVFGGKK